MAQNVPVPSPAAAGGPTAPAVGSGQLMSSMSNINLMSPSPSSTQSPGNIITPSPALTLTGAPSPSSVLNTPGIFYGCTVHQLYVVID